MIRTACRAFTTWTRQGWLDEAKSIQNRLEVLETQIYQRQLNKPAFEAVFRQISENIGSLNKVQFKEGEAPMYQGEVIGELYESAERIRETGKKIFWDVKY